MSDSENDLCPLCLEDADKGFRPCPCGYQICLFCYNQICEHENGLCPACRRPYSKEDASYEISKEKPKKKKKKDEKEQKEQPGPKRSLEGLENVRVIQKNLVYVSNLPQKYLNEQSLRQLFGSYGKIVRILLNNESGQSAYITFSKDEEARAAIVSKDDFELDGQILRVMLGLTKYCSQFLNGNPCKYPNCIYRHEMADEDCTFTLQEVREGNHYLRYGTKVLDAMGKKQDQTTSSSGPQIVKNEPIKVEAPKPEVVTKKESQKNEPKSFASVVSSTLSHQPHQPQPQPQPQPQSQSQSQSNQTQGPIQITNQQQHVPPKYEPKIDKLIPPPKTKNQTPKKLVPIVIDLEKYDIKELEIPPLESGIDDMVLALLANGENEGNGENELQNNLESPINEKKEGEEGEDANTKSEMESQFTQEQILSWGLLNDEIKEVQTNISAPPGFENFIPINRPNIEPENNQTENQDQTQTQTQTPIQTQNDLPQLQTSPQLQNIETNMIEPVWKIGAIDLHQQAGKGRGRGRGRGSNTPQTHSLQPQSPNLLPNATNFTPTITPTISQLSQQPLISSVTNFTPTISQQPLISNASNFTITPQEQSPILPHTPYTPQPVTSYNEYITSPTLPQASSYFPTQQGLNSGLQPIKTPLLPPGGRGRGSREPPQIQPILATNKPKVFLDEPDEEINPESLLLGFLTNKQTSPLPPPLNLEPIQQFPSNENLSQEEEEEQYYDIEDNEEDYFSDSGSSVTFSDDEDILNQKVDFSSSQSFENFGVLATERDARYLTIIEKLKTASNVPDTQDAFKSYLKSKLGLTDENDLRVLWNKWSVTLAPNPVVGVQTNSKICYKCGKAFQSSALCGVHLASCQGGDKQLTSLPLRSLPGGGGILLSAEEKAHLKDIFNELLRRASSVPRGQREFMAYVVKLGYTLTDIQMSKLFSKWVSESKKSKRPRSTSRPSSSSSSLRSTSTSSYRSTISSTQSSIRKPSLTSSFPSSSSYSRPVSQLSVRPKNPVSSSSSSSWKELAKAKSNS